MFTDQVNNLHWRMTELLRRINFTKKKERRNNYG